MEYELTQHAKDVIKERGIQMRWVENAINFPQLIETTRTTTIGLEHHLAVIPDYGNRVLRVIISVRASPVRIVTAYFDRSMTKSMMDQI